MLIQMLVVAIHPVLLYSYTMHVELPVGAVYSWWCHGPRVIYTRVNSPAHCSLEADDPAR